LQRAICHIQPGGHIGRIGLDVPDITLVT
jgi:hypothetical protein